MASGENFKLLEPIADRLGAAIGASRAAVDSGFAGVTGRELDLDLIPRLQPRREAGDLELDGETVAEIDALF